MNLKPLFLLGASIAGYLFLLRINPVRASMRDGLRAIRRYPGIWVTLGVFGFSYAFFQLSLRIYFHNVLPPANRPPFIWAREAWHDPNLWLTGSPESLWVLSRTDFLHLLPEALLPAAENLAGIFNSLVATFPVSAVAAVMLLVNWGDHHRELIRALRARFDAGAWAIHSFIVTCALAAIAKPFMYAVPPLLELAGTRPEANLLWFRWSPVVAWLSFLFEYLLGICIQIYLILLAYAWVRGMTFSHSHLFDFAIRRFSYVVKWAAIIMLLSTIFIDAPLILKNFAPLQHFFPEENVFGTRLTIAHVALAVFVLLTATMQIMLTFHNESWRAAMRDHFQFMRHRWWPFGWFFFVAALHLFALHVCDLSARRGFGEGTALWVGWILVFPWIAAAVSGWLLASWVSVFRRCDTTRARTDNWVQF